MADPQQAISLLPLSPSQGIPGLIFLHLTICSQVVVPFVSDLRVRQ